MYNKYTKEIEKGLPLKACIFIIILSLLMILLSCSRQEYVYWNGIYMPPQEKK